MDYLDRGTGNQIVAVRLDELLALVAEMHKLGASTDTIRELLNLISDSERVDTCPSCERYVIPPDHLDSKWIGTSGADGAKVK